MVGVTADTISAKAMAVRPRPQHLDPRSAKRAEKNRTRVLRGTSP